MASERSFLKRDQNRACKGNSPRTPEYNEAKMKIQNSIERKLFTMQVLLRTAIVAFAFSELGATALPTLLDEPLPLVGTDGHGHAYPGATVPFGMVQLSPDTGTDGWDWCSGYHYPDSVIQGFSHTHLSGTGGSCLGDVLLMPTIGEVHLKAGTPGDGYASKFAHAQEVAT